MNEYEKELHEFNRKEIYEVADNIKKYGVNDSDVTFELLTAYLNEINSDDDILNYIIVILISALIMHFGYVIFGITIAFCTTWAMIEHLNNRRKLNYCQDLIIQLLKEKAVSISEKL